MSEALSSVLQQSYQDIRLIVVDDSSVDQTRLVLNDFASSDSRVIVLSNNCSLGLTKSLNKALDVAVTPWIARIDHDDVWHPEKLSRQMNFLASNPEIDLLGTAYKEMDEDGGNLRNAVLPLCRTDKEIRKALYQFNPFFHSSIVARRDIVQELGGYNERFVYAQDYELWVRLLHRTQAAILPVVLCYRRVGDDNISVRKERTQRFNALKAKILWARLNGVKKDVFLPALRDISVVLAPDTVKKLVRCRLHGEG